MIQSIEQIIGNAEDRQNADAVLSKIDKEETILNISEVFVRGYPDIPNEYSADFWIRVVTYRVGK